MTILPSLPSEKAVNLARRWSVLNENDLVQEDFSEASSSPLTSPKQQRSFDHDYCAKISEHMMKVSSLPVECSKFTDVTSNLKRRESDTTHPTQYMS